MFNRIRESIDLINYIIEIIIYSIIAQDFKITDHLVHANVQLEMRPNERK